MKTLSALSIRVQLTLLAAMFVLPAAGLTVWSAQAPVAAVAQNDDEPLMGALDPGVEQTVLASRNGLSSEDVFNIVVDRNYEGNSK